MRIIILGAGGQIGKELVYSLGYAFPAAEIIGTKRKLNPVFTRPEKPTAMNVRILQFDPFTHNWEKLGKVSVLINVIGIIQETPENSFGKIHAGLTKLILTNREKIGNPKVIQFSVLGAHAQSNSEFLRTKGQADAALLQQDNTVVMRPSVVCTPNTVLVQKLRMLQQLSKLLFYYLPFPAELLNTKIQPVMIKDVMDLVQTLCQTTDHPSLICLGGPEQITLKQFLQMLPVKGLQILQLPQNRFSRILKICTSIFPKLLNAEQIKLLQQDNTTDTQWCETLLKRPMTSTLPFWQKELQFYQS